MQSPTFRQGSLLVWLDKYPENSKHEHEDMLRHVHTVKFSTHPVRERAAVRYLRIGDPAQYALLGASFSRQETDKLIIEVMVSVQSETTLGGLEREYAQEVFGVAVLQAFIQSQAIESLGSGTLTFDYAQTHRVDTSPFALMLATLYVLRLLVSSHLTQADAIFDDLRATRLLTDIGRDDTHLIPGLAEAVRYPELSVRQKALTLMGQVADPSFYQILLDALNQSETRDVAIAALGTAGFEDAIRHLIPLLRNTVTSLRAALALKKLGWRPSVQADQIALAVAAHDWNDVVPFGSAAIPALLDVIQNDNGIAVVDAL